MVYCLRFWVIFLPPQAVEFYPSIHLSLWSSFWGSLYLPTLRTRPHGLAQRCRLGVRPLQRWRLQQLQRQNRPEVYYDTPDHKRAFGYIWNNYESVHNRIGSPKVAEANAINFVVQDFATGLIFYFLENQANNYVLISDTATWHKQQE